MSYTPVELRHVRVGRSLFGYNRATVEQLIDEVAQSFEVTWRERGELADQVESLEQQLEEHRRREQLLSQTLIAAEQAAADVRERARREAETIISEAHGEARAIGRTAQSERERLLGEAQRIRSLLRSALGVLDEGTGALAGEKPAAAKAPPRPGAQREAPPVLPPVLAEPPLGEIAPEAWREDTREFEPIAEAVTPPPPPEPEPSAAPVEVSAAPPAGEAADHGTAAPVLQRIAGRESRDFDWGE
jgi:cell division initiation protein